MLYWIRKYITQRWHVIKTGLKPGYHDLDELMLWGMMSLLVSYIEENQPYLENQILKGEKLDDDLPNYYLKNAQERVEIYKWWKNYPNRQEEIEKMWDAVSTSSKLNNSQDINSWLESTKNERERIRIAEDRLNEEEDDMLVRLVKVRGGLWT